MSESVVIPLNDSVVLKNLKLPTISKQGMKSLEIINAENLKFKDLESALSADPMLTGILLKYANSPIYRKYVEITNVRKAINLLGIDIVKSAILICTMRSYCEPSNPAKEMLWGKSMSLSIMTGLIAHKAFRKLAEEIELSAMMSQIGGLVLSSNFVAEYAVVVENSITNNIMLEQAEFETFGLQRADVTVFALEKLRLPKDIINALEMYYQESTPTQIETKIDKHVVTLRLASLLIENKDNEATLKQNETILALMDTLGLVESDIDNFIDAYDDRVAENFSF